MAVSNAERRAVILALLAEFDEDYGTVARFIRALRAAAPSVAWKAELDAQAMTWQPFRDSGLSVQWWLDQVARLSQ